MTIKEDKKLASVQTYYKKHCQFCGHSISFYAFEPDRKLCNYCGRYNYRNDLIKFKELLNKKKREVENES